MRQHLVQVTHDIELQKYSSYFDSVFPQQIINIVIYRIRTGYSSHIEISIHFCNIAGLYSWQM